MAWAAALCAGTTYSANALAQAKSASAQPASPWSVSVGLGLARTAEYEGAKRTVSGLAPDLNVSYKTDGFGTLGLGSKARGVSWTFIDQENYSVGISLGSAPGRVDNKDGTLLRPGGKRLRGMGEIKNSSEYSLFGHYVVGIPIIASYTKGSGSGAADATGAVSGHGGARFELSTELPWNVSPELTLSVSPSLTWADAKYTQTYFGVTAAQAARSGFARYTPSAGVKNFGLSLGAQYKLAPQWSATGGVAFSTLRGDAAKSPLVQQKNSTNVFAGVNYTF